MIFSGDSSMTLKYGHMLTLWRLLATGLFGSSTLPRLYNCYSSHIHEKAAAATNFWNVVIVKTRVITGLGKVLPPIGSEDVQFIVILKHVEAQLHGICFGSLCFCINTVLLLSAFHGIFCCSFIVV